MAASRFLCEAITEAAALHDLIDYYAAEGRSALDAVGRAFRSGGHRRVAFAGMGSSYAAAFAVLDDLIAAGIPAIATTAQKLARDRASLITRDTLVIAISKSGNTREVLDLVEGMDDRSGLIAVVNQPESRLADRCAVLLPMMAGVETQIASKSFLCTLAILNLLAGELTGAPRCGSLNALRTIEHWASGYLAAVMQNGEALRAMMENCTCIDVVAGGASFATAYKSALVLREVPRVIAAAIDAADYAHGWAKVAGPRYRAIVLAPEYRRESTETRVVAQILERGGGVILITGSAATAQEGLTVIRHPPVPERLAPLAQAVVCDAMIGAMAIGATGL